MRRIIILCFLIALLAGCGSEKGHQQLITIASTGEFLNATVYMDGRKIGQLQFLRFHGSWFDKLLKKKHGKSPMDDAVALNMAINSSLAPGDHEIKIEKKGYKTYFETFKWPPPPGEQSIFIYAIPEMDASPGK